MANYMDSYDETFTRKKKKEFIQAPVLTNEQAISYGMPQEQQPGRVMAPYQAPGPGGSQITLYGTNAVPLTAQQQASNAAIRANRIHDAMRQTQMLRQLRDSGKDPEEYKVVEGPGGLTVQRKTFEDRHQDWEQRIMDDRLIRGLVGGGTPGQGPSMEDQMGTGGGRGRRGRGGFLGGGGGFDTGLDVSNLSPEARQQVLRWRKEALARYAGIKESEGFAGTQDIEQFKDMVLNRMGSMEGFGHVKGWFERVIEGDLRRNYPDIYSQHVAQQQQEAMKAEFERVKADRIKDSAEPGETEDQTIARMKENGIFPMLDPKTGTIGVEPATKPSERTLAERQNATVYDEYQRNYMYYRNRGETIIPGKKPGTVEIGKLPESDAEVFQKGERKGREIFDREETENRRLQRDYEQAGVPQDQRKVARWNDRLGRMEYVSPKEGKDTEEDLPPRAQVISKMSSDQSAQLKAAALQAITLVQSGTRFIVEKPDDMGGVKVVPKPDATDEEYRKALDYMNDVMAGLGRKGGIE